jgi:glycosyltransferase involved in cell wall biosynthesis
VTEQDSLRRLFRLPAVREQQRTEALRRFAVDSARSEFEIRYPRARFGPIVAVIAAYEEEQNIGDVLKAMPTLVGDLEVSTLVVVDGGTDRTAEVAFDAGALTCVLPVNLGHGAALRAGYELAVSHGARYVVTLDADGQNDPAEIPTMLEPLLDDTADFVVGSRRLGVDQTTDRFRQLGVRVYAGVLDAIVRQDLTDSSSGYRAFRGELVADILPHLIQDQYQTAEVLIVASARGWRITEQPTVWHPRASGESKKGSNLVFGAQYARVIATTWWRTTFGNRSRP